MPHVTLMIRGRICSWQQALLTFPGRRGPQHPNPCPHAGRSTDRLPPASTTALMSTADTASAESTGRVGYQIRRGPMTTCAWFVICVTQPQRVATVMQFPTVMAQDGVNAVMAFATKDVRPPSGIQNTGTEVVANEPADRVPVHDTGWGLQKCWG